MPIVGSAFFVKSQVGLLPCCVLLVGVFALIYSFAIYLTSWFSLLILRVFIVVVLLLFWELALHGHLLRLRFRSNFSLMYSLIVLTLKFQTTFIAMHSALFVFALLIQLMLPLSNWVTNYDMFDGNAINVTAFVIALHSSLFINFCSRSLTRFLWASRFYFLVFPFVCCLSSSPCPWLRVWAFFHYLLASLVTLLVAFLVCFCPYILMILSKSMFSWLSTSVSLGQYPPFIILPRRSFTNLF